MFGRVVGTDVVGVGTSMLAWDEAEGDSTEAAAAACTPGTGVVGDNEPVARPTAADAS